MTPEQNNEYHYLPPEHPGASCLLVCLVILLAAALLSNWS